MPAGQAAERPLAMGGAGPGKVLRERAPDEPLRVVFFTASYFVLDGVTLTIRKILAALKVGWLTKFPRHTLTAPSAPPPSLRAGSQRFASPPSPLSSVLIKTPPLPPWPLSWRVPRRSSSQPPPLPTPWGSSGLSRAKTWCWSPVSPSPWSRSTTGTVGGVTLPLPHRRQHRCISAAAAADAAESTLPQRAAGPTRALLPTVAVWSPCSSLIAVTGPPRRMGPGGAAPPCARAPGGGAWQVRHWPRPLARSAAAARGVQAPRRPLHGENPSQRIRGSPLAVSSCFCAPCQRCAVEGRVVAGRV